MSLLESTALASTAAVPDALGVANLVRSQTLLIREPLLLMAVPYLVLALLIEHIFKEFAARLPQRHPLQAP
ncbi:hypothetical protein [Verminephrobacter eiseniae]|uniref:hypothetical protein n=1 Tax=Verminephrobacter eiseniae TaxID=364317 RepID=UPI00223880C2|nr:hypothetical protein [Verminephrobacter eiseniae]